MFPSPAFGTRAAIVMLLAAVIALAICNLGSYEAFHAFWSAPLASGELLGGRVLTTGGFVNQGLMAIFFFLMGLRIKHEVLRGSLASLKTASLPAFAAIGGVVVPVAVYLLCCSGHAEARAGWGIPTATGVAFAIGIMALRSKGSESAEEAVLGSAALVGDVMTLLVVAAYTRDLDIIWLVISLALFAVALVLNRKGVKALLPYLLLGPILWFCVFRSDVHPTLAGVLLAVAIPDGKPADSSRETPAQVLIRTLAPWVFFLIVPLFALSNSAINLVGTNLGGLLSDPVFLGCFLGLLAGKPLGIFLTSLLAMKLKMAALPKGCTRMGIARVGFFCGIGFPMAIFVASLAFTDGAALDAARAGILLASLASGLVGVLLPAGKASQIRS